MSEEKSLSQIAYEKFYLTRGTADDIFYEVASAVEKEVLARLKKDEEEPVAGQELTIGQAAKIAEDNGSTDILEYFNDDLSRFMPCGYSNCIYLGSIYRVAHKKVNDPDDHTTWQDDVDIFARDNVSAPWIATKFKGYFKNFDYPYRTLKTSNGSSFKFAKLATPEQVATWKLINDDL